MPVGLSYPGLRCVLEHLDAIKRKVVFKTFIVSNTIFFRIRIASRSAVLQRCEKSIPLRLNCLDITDVGRSLDYFSIDIKRNDLKLEFTNDKNERVWERKVPQNMDSQTVENKIDQYYIGGRSKIYVKRLHVFDPPSSPLLSVESKFITAEFDAKYNDFENFLQIIDPISFPLKYLRTGTGGLHTYDHPVLRSAETLLIDLSEEQSEAEMICLQKLPCKTISFFYDLEIIDTVRMINYMIENPKEIGTKYTFIEFNRKFVYSELMRIKQAFEGNRHDLEETTSFGRKYYPRFCIPVNPISKLHVYAVENDKQCFFIIKVVPESGEEFTEKAELVAQSSIK